MELGKIGIKLGTKHVTYQKLTNFLWKNQILFYRPEHNTNGGPHVTKF